MAITNQIIGEATQKAKMEIENLGALASRDQSPILDLGDGFQ